MRRILLIVATITLLLAYVKTKEILLAISSLGFLIATIFDYLSIRRS